MFIVVCIVFFILIVANIWFTISESVKHRQMESHYDAEIRDLKIINERQHDINNLLDTHLKNLEYRCDKRIRQLIDAYNEE